uniref:ATP synthase F0 subunit 8 n=1 Tax=Eurythoe complanata TaxID=167815 RepID=A0A0S2N0H5_EURCO|nr:ATP synthase F0 subunit 8 [Eurythoe complanata]ALO81722.1 ATP synthase F0 subunit 8 [Eurythoe complanata]
MPHLAPLSWMFATLMFWLTLLFFASSIWWAQSPSFPTSNSSLLSSSFSQWNW